MLDPVNGRWTSGSTSSPNQGLTSIALAGDHAYVAGDTWGGGGTPPTEPTSQVAGANHRDTLYRVGPGLDEAEVLYPEIGTNWYTVPRLVPTGRDHIEPQMVSQNLGPGRPMRDRAG